MDSMSEIWKLQFSILNNTFVGGHTLHLFYLFLARSWKAFLLLILNSSTPYELKKQKQTYSMTFEVRSQTNESYEQWIVLNDSQTWESPVWISMTNPSRNELTKSFRSAESYRLQQRMQTFHLYLYTSHSLFMHIFIFITNYKMCGHAINLIILI